MNRGVGPAASRLPELTFVGYSDLSAPKSHETTDTAPSSNAFVFQLLRVLHQLSGHVLPSLFENFLLFLRNSLGISKLQQANHDESGIDGVR